ncbi:unnamed protein product [Linum trigynum]|uniref:F-box domain-containing protein n=1 Tax=Linum trigynum TaxID=586398 RepID=A0AAV2EFW6_9ROSI
MSDSVPPEIIADILDRLTDAADLVRCRRVSKQWLSVLDSPDFIERHLQRSTAALSNAGLFLRNADGALFYAPDSASDSPRPDPKLPTHPDGALLLGSCRGLVCFSVDNQRDLVILNPRTGERRQICNYSPPDFPQHPCPAVNPHISKLDARMFVEYSTDSRRGKDVDLEADGGGLATLVLGGYGFGYDESSDDYKVVRIRGLVGGAESHHFRAEIYSVRAKSCRIMEPTGLPYPNHRNGVFACGALNWVAHNDVLLALDLGSDGGFSLLPQPKYMRGRPEVKSLGELDSRLCLCGGHYVGDGQGRLDLWVMKEYGKVGSWCKVWSIRDPIVVRCGPAFLLGCSAIDGGGRRMLFMVDGRVWFWYYPSLDRVEAVDMGGIVVGEGGFDAAYCLESLVRLFDRGYDQKVVLASL